MRAMINALIAASTVTGCVTARAEFVPTEVRQEIGSTRMLTAVAKWNCEGGEQLGLLPDDSLFVASQDFIVSRNGGDSARKIFSYKRSSDGWNTVGAGVAFTYSIPADDRSPAFVQYGTLHRSGFASHEYAGYSESTTTFRYVPAWADRCWPADTPADDAFVVRYTYRGVQAQSQRPAGRHFRIEVCASNVGEEVEGPHKGQLYPLVRITGEARTEHARRLSAGAGGGADMSVAPPDFWLADDGTITVGRIDGKLLQLTHPYSYGGSHGFLYERANVPIYVNPERGQESLYIYQWQGDPENPDEQRPRDLGTRPDNSDFVMSCTMREVP